MKKNVIWAYFSQFSTIASGLLILPLVVYKLPAEEVGIFYVFITFAYFAQLLEFGFQPTISRNITYVYNGVQFLRKTGVPVVTENTETNKQLLASLISSSKKIYQFVAIFSIVILLFGGTFYISTLNGVANNAAYIYSGWFAFALGQVATFYFNYYNCALIGRGNIAESYKIIVITRLSFLFLTSILLYLNLGLLGVGLGSLISSIIGRGSAGYFFKKLVYPDILGQQRNYNNKEIIHILWHNAYRVGTVQVGGFLILRANLLVASSFIGLREAASYGLTMSLFSALNSVASVFAQVQVPRMNALQAQRDIYKLKAAFGSILIVSWLIYLGGFALLVIFGRWSLVVIGSQTELIQDMQLIALGVIFLLELNHSMAATYITTTNKILFVKAALWSGVAIMLLSFMLVEQYNLWALIFSQGIVQLLYNNWKWPVIALRHLQGDISEILEAGANEIRRRVW